jgi:hypothetical protein
MTLLNNLKFVTLAPRTNSNPIALRRRKLAAKIDEQLALAADADYTLTKFKWVTDEDGKETKVEVPKRVKRWWNENSDGAVQLTIRYGSKPIEFEKGKCAISVATLADVAPTLEAVKVAVESGELDDLLEVQFAFGKRVANAKANPK